MEKQYLTVKEYAEGAGITTQAVYKQMKKQLAPFVVEQDGKKLILATALQTSCKPEEEENPEESSPEDDGCQQVTNQLQTVTNQVIEILRQQLETKDRQLEEKDKQIEDLSVRLSEALALVRGQQLIEAAEVQQKKNGFFYRLFHKGE